MSKILVAYFSPTGTTKRAAQDIAKALEADLYEIRPETPYTSGDLNWMDKHSRSTVEMNDPASRPAMAGDVPDVSGYDTVFLGYPNWWGTMPMALFTLLEGIDLSGKRILPFCTNEGSGMGRSEFDLRKLCPGAIVEQGLSIHGAEAAASKPKVERWLQNQL